MIRKSLVFLITASVVQGYALSTNTPVDYWHTEEAPKKIAIKKEISKKEINKKEVGKPKLIEEINPQEILQNPHLKAVLEDKATKQDIKWVATHQKDIPSKILTQIPEDMVLRISKYQFAQKFKKKHTLITYLYLKNPLQFAGTYWDWYAWQARTAGLMSNNMIVRARLNYQKENIHFLVDWFKRHHIALMYFYQPGCEYCMLTDPTIATLKSYGILVFRINIAEHPNAAAKWNIAGTPTTIAVDPIDHIAVPYAGAFGDAQPVLYYFYQMITQRIQEKEEGESKLYD